MQRVSCNKKHKLQEELNHLVFNIILALFRYLPSDEISREALHVETPEVFIGSSTDVHAVSAGCEASLNHAISIDEALTSQSIDLKGVPHVRIQKLVNWMHCT